MFNLSCAENSTVGLRKAIMIYGLPKELIIDNGGHFKNVHSKRTHYDPVKKVESEFKIEQITKSRNI